SAHGRTRYPLQHRSGRRVLPSQPDLEAEPSDTQAARYPLRPLLALALLVLAQCGDVNAGQETIRFATFNIEDVRTVDLLDPTHPRLAKAAAAIQELRPDILLVNELTYDYPELAANDGLPAGSNAARFAETFLASDYSFYQPKT